MLRFARSRDADSPVPVVYRSVEELKSRRLKEVIAIWQGKRQGAGLPSAEAFDILDYGPAMANINLIAVRHDPLDFVFRVHSVQGAGYIGKDMTGCSVDDYPEPQYARFIRAIFTEAVTTREPNVVIEDMFVTDTRLMRWEGLVMPLQDKDGRVATLLVAFELFH